MNVKVNENKSMGILGIHKFAVTEDISTISVGFKRVDESLVTKITDGQCIRAGETWVEFSDGEMIFGVDNVIVDEVEKIISEVRNQVQIMVRKYLEHARFAEIFAEQKENLGEDEE